MVPPPRPMLTSSAVEVTANYVIGARSRLSLASLTLSNSQLCFRNDSLAQVRIFRIQATPFITERAFVVQL